MFKNPPSFFIYGEPARPIDVGFLHAETVMARKHVHFGKVRPHQHDAMAQITFWTKGRGVYLIEGQFMDFSAPAVSFVPSGVVHGFTVAPDETDAIVISIADGILPLIAEMAVLPLNEPIMLRSPENAALLQRCAVIGRMILDEYEQAQPCVERIVMPLIASMFAQMARIADIAPSAALSPQRPLAMQLRKLVDLHFRDNWPVGRYIAALHTTPHLLARACETSFGMQVKELIVERRLLEAKRLLLFTIRSIDDISFELGLKDAAYFSRFFRQHVGLPPGEWRRRRITTLGGALSAHAAGAGTVDKRAG